MRGRAGLRGKWSRRRESSKRRRSGGRSKDRGNETQVTRTGREVKVPCKRATENGESGKRSGDEDQRATEKNIVVTGQDKQYPRDAKRHRPSKGRRRRSLTENGALQLAHVCTKKARVSRHARAHARKIRVAARAPEKKHV